MNTPTTALRDKAQAIRRESSLFGSTPKPRLGRLQQVQWRDAPTSTERSPQGRSQLVHHLSQHERYDRRNSRTIRQENCPSTTGTQADCTVEIVVWYPTLNVQMAVPMAGPPSGQVIPVR